MIRGIAVKLGMDTQARTLAWYKQNSRLLKCADQEGLERRVFRLGNKKEGCVL